MTFFFLWSKVSTGPLFFFFAGPFLSFLLWRTRYVHILSPNSCLSLPVHPFLQSFAFFQLHGRRYFIFFPFSSLETAGSLYAPAASFRAIYAAGSPASLNSRVIDRAPFPSFEFMRLRSSLARLTPKKSSCILSRVTFSCRRFFLPTARPSSSLTLHDPVSLL